MALFTSILSFFILINLSSVTCQRLREKMYIPFDGAFCFRRLNGTHQVGCSSSLNGDTGVVHLVETFEDINWLVNKAEAYPYVAVVQLKDFSSNNMIKLRDSGKISGMILWNNGTAEGFSTDDSCPNRASGLASEACDATEKWNPNGNGLLLVNWGFPIAYIDKLESITKIKECFDKFNSKLEGQTERALCSLQLRSHMLAAVDTKTCLRKGALSSFMQDTRSSRYCDPLGDYSLFNTISTTPDPGNKKWIIFMARQDGASLVDNVVPGASSPVVDIVTFLTITAYLKQMDAYQIDGNDNKYNLMLLLLNGESFDYIGSSRIVYEMEKKNFPSADHPITLDDIALIIEIDQILGEPVYYHSKNDTSETVVKFLNILRNNFNKSKINFTSAVGKLPPASVQRFLRKKEDIPHLIFTNYDNSYNNRYYHSVLDTAKAMNYKYANGTLNFGDVQKNISSIAKGIAFSLYDIVFTSPYYKDVPDKSELVDELLYCYLENNNCSMFVNVSTDYIKELPTAPFQLYVGVNESSNLITKLTLSTMIYLSGTPKDVANRTACVTSSILGETGYWMNEKCYISNAQQFVAVSPAFDIEGYDWLSNEYSSWTESIWRDFSIEMFLSPSYKQQVFSLTLGILVLILSFVIVYFVDSKYEILFNQVVLRSGSSW